MRKVVVPGVSGKGERKVLIVSDQPLSELEEVSRGVECREMGQEEERPGWRH